MNSGKRIRIFACALAMLMHLAFAHESDAATCPGSTIDVSASPYNGLYELGADYDRGSTNSNCFTFSGTGIVDLKGYDITATNGLNAIDCSSGQIQVRDSGNSTTKAKGEITGTWTNAAIQNCETVDGVRITGGGANTGIYTSSAKSAEAIKNNFVEAGQYGIVATFVKDRQSRIVDNIVRAAVIGIETDYMRDSSGSGTALLDGNIVYDGEFFGIVAYAPHTLVSNNLVTDWSPNPLSGYTAYPIYNWAMAAAGNYCDPCAGAPDCDDSACSFNSADADPYDFPVNATGACPGVITANYTLPSDLDFNSTSGACITINTANVSVDLNGHVITNSAGGGIGIQCGATTNSVVSDGGIRERTRDGSFSTAVQGCRQVVGVRIKGASTGVSNVASNNNALDNLTGSIIDADNIGVEAILEKRNSQVTYNKIRSGHKGIHITNILNSGTGKADIAFNVIRESHEYAVKVTAGQSYANVHDTLMLRRDPSMISPTTSTCLDVGSSTTSKLSCDCADDCPDANTPPVIYPF